MTPHNSKEILLTGFPGFLANRLLKALLEAQPQASVHLLVLKRTMDVARYHLQAHLSVEQQQRCHLIEGDITRPDLGIPAADLDALSARVDTVWHLAAIYDLTVSSHAAYRVNVAGTTHILDFCERCANFARLNYISTCYVSGLRTGTILEGELDRQQSFKNHYEETKFWAEVEVQRRMDSLPTVIFRPGIVVGDSQTGQTDKYDGPYFLFQFLERLPKWMPVPQLGAKDSVVNLVPIDFVVNAMIAIGHRPNATGQVYQLADPKPMTAQSILALTLQLLDRKRLDLQVPVNAIDRLLGASSTIEDTVGLPQEAVSYFSHDARYDTSNTSRAIADMPELRCPHLSTYLHRLLQYMIDHPKDHAW